MTVKSRLLRFPDYTTTHGLPHVKRSLNPLARVFWMVITLSAVGYVIYQVVLLIIDYYKWKVTVNVDVGFEFNMIFPAITICNLNPVRWHVLKEIDNEAAREIKELLSEHDEKKRRRRRRRRSGHDVDDLETEDGHSSGGVRVKRELNISMLVNDDHAKQLWEEQISQPDFYNDPTELQRDRTIIYNALNTLDDADRRLLGHHLYTMLIDCSYNSLSCSPENFTHFLDPYLGNCYTFNSGLDQNKTLVRSPRAGARNGLSMMLYVEQDQYLPHVAPSAGFKVVVHNQTQVPMVEENGITVSPGIATHIGLRKLEMRRESFPYSNCLHVKQQEEAFKNIFHEVVPNSYSRHACLLSCFQLSLAKICKCYDPKLPSDSFVNTSISWCDISDAEQGECVENVDFLHMNDQLGCHCPLPCEETSYSMTISSAHWPAETFRDAVIEEVIVTGHMAIGHILETDPHMFDVNLARLEIFMNDLNYELIAESPAYTQVGLASDLGGQLGLWIGISILTILEYIELVFLCFKDAILRRKDSDETVDEQKSSEKNHFENDPGLDNKALRSA